jgi:hypothetical protein
MRVNRVAVAKRHFNVARRAQIRYAFGEAMLKNQGAAAADCLWHGNHIAVGAGSPHNRRVDG